MAITGHGKPRIFSTAIDADDSSAQEDLGTIREEYDSTNGLKTYMYVKASGAIANGTLCVFNGTGGYTVGPNTTTATGGVTGHTVAVAVGIGTITTGQYGWVQIRGYHNAIKCHSKYIQSAYRIGYTVSGTFKGGDTGGVGSYAISNPALTNITPFVNGACACTTMSGFINLM